MSFRTQTVWLSAVMLIVASCGDGSSSTEDGVDIVVTTTVLGDIVRSIVGSSATVQILMPLGADSHDFQASAQQVAGINKADLVVANGLGLEEGLELVLATAADDGARVLKVGPSVDPMPLRSEPDSPDPHVWLDPTRMMTAVDVIVEELNQVDGSVDWYALGEVYKEELAVLDGDLQALLGTVPINSRMLVTNHDSLRYFARRNGLQVVGVVIPGGSTLADPSSEELANLVQVMEDNEVSAIFTETTEPTLLAETVAAEVGPHVEVVELYIGSLGAPGSGAETYLKMLRTNADRMVAALDR